MNKMKQKIGKVLIGFLISLTMISCNKNPDYRKLEEQVGKITSISELGTVEYVIAKIVKADDDATWYKFGDRKILFTCKATLKAGIDLSELKSCDIKPDFENKTISIMLPKAKLLLFNMKPEDVALTYEKTSLTRSSFSNKERDAVLAQGEKNILESVPNMGILIDAEKNAKSFLESFLKQAGYTNVNVEFKDE